MSKLPSLNVHNPIASPCSPLQEVHKKAIISELPEGQTEQVQFPRDENGQYNAENGTYLDRKKALQVKFPQEARLCLGVAVKLDNNGDQEGCRLMPYDYTQKWIITVDEEEKRIKTEIAKVKALPRDAKGWSTNPRPEDVLYLDDPVTRIKDIGRIKSNKLKEFGVETVADLLGLDKLSIKALKQQLPSVKKYIETCGNVVVPENAPDPGSYIDAKNPYAARYGEKKDEWGEEEWRKQIKKSSSFAGVVSIKDMVKHIVIESQKLYKGTCFERSYHFYHDALSQLTHSSCVQWMKDTLLPGEDRVIYDCWIKPELGLNDQYGSRWWQRPIGNSPELMPLDNSLNQDIHVAVRRNTMWSLVLRKFVSHGDNRLFSMATPRLIAAAYTRAVNPITGISPSPKRIVQDVNKAVNAILVIFNAKGVYVEGLASGRTGGHRHTSQLTMDNNWGGKRMRHEYNPTLNDELMHEDIRCIMDEQCDTIMTLSSLFSPLSNIDDDISNDKDNGNYQEEKVEARVDDEQDLDQHYGQHCEKG